MPRKENKTNTSNASIEWYSMRVCCHPQIQEVQTVLVVSSMPFWEVATNAPNTTSWRGSRSTGEVEGGEELHGHKHVRPRLFPESSTAYNPRIYPPEPSFALGNTSVAVA